MTSRFTLDTNILSYYIRGNEDISSRLKTELSKGNKLVMNPIAYYEINRGLLAINSQKKLQKFKGFCRKFGVLELSLDVLDIAANKYADLKKRGKLVEDADLFIAAICLANDLVLITNNEKHFRHIDGLKINNWVNEL